MCAVACSSVSAMGAVSNINVKKLKTITRQKLLVYLIASD